MSIINDVLVDKLFKDPPKRTKEIPLLSEKTASGDGMVVINDAYSDFPIKNLTLQGNTKQDSTTGKNLFDVNAEENGYIGIDGVIYPQQGIKNEKYGDYIPINRFYKTVCVTSFVTVIGESVDESPWCGVAFYDKDKKFIIRVASGKTIVKANIPENAFYMIGTYRKYKDGVLQIEYGSVSTEYEPYAGGKPSPSPDYPQEIKNVGKWNEETQKYEVDVILNGGNLWNKDGIVRGHIDKNTGEIIRVENATSYVYTVIVPIDGKYTIRVEKENTYGTYFIAVFNGEYYNPYIRLKPGMKNVLTLKKGKNKIEVSGIENNYIHSDKITLSYSEKEPLEYEPYREPQSLKITSDRPITKWDKLVEQDGQIGWLYQSKEIVLNGSETEEWRKTGVNDVYQLYGFDGTYKDYEVFCDKLVNYKASVNHITENSILANTNYLYVRISGITDIQTLRDFLNSNNLKVVYYSKTQEFIPLPQDEQNAIRALTTYYPTTVVTVDGGELPVGIEVTYMHPEYIPTKQSALRMWFKENPII